MKKENNQWHPATYATAFLVGVILFWSLGSGWLDIGSLSVFLAGLIGVALAVLLFGVWNLYYNSHHKEN